MLRGEFEVLLPTTFGLETPVAMVGVTFGALILILVVFNLAAENDLANGIGLICRGAPVATAVPLDKGVATAKRGPEAGTEV